MDNIFLDENRSNRKLEKFFYLNYNGSYISSLGDNRNAGPRLEQDSAGKTINLLIGNGASHKDLKFHLGNKIKENQWHNLVAIKIDDKAYAYVDGVLVHTLTEVSGPNGFYNLTLGGSYNTSRYYKGYIDDFKIYTGTLIIPQ